MDAPKVDCQNCGCPDQHIGIACGFCHHTVEAPAGMLAPDGSLREIKALYGYKGFNIRYIDGKPRLNSPVYPMIWEPGKTEVAICEGHMGSLTVPDAQRHGPQNPDPAMWSPVKSCGGGAHGCGFYSGRTREHQINLGYGRYHPDSPSVVAKVQISGKIIPATNGWRSQECTIVEIWVPHVFWKLCTELKKEYASPDCEVVLGATLLTEKTDTPRFCAKCKAKMTARTTRCTFCGHEHN